MLENLLNLVKEHAQEAIVNNSAVPNEHNDAAIQEVTNAIHSGLSNSAQGGGLESIMQMFGGQAGNVAGNPIVQNIINTAASSLSSKFGVDSSQASSIVSSLIPQVMNHFTQQTADPNNSSFDLNSVIGSLTGGSQGGGGIASMIGSFLK